MPATGAPSRAFDRVIERLDGVRMRGRDRATAICPAHDDREPSLSVAAGHDCALLTCFAGCAVEDIAAALGLEMRDLFDADGATVSRYPDGHEVIRRPVPRPPGERAGKPRKAITQRGAPSRTRLFEHPRSMPLAEAVAARVPVAVVEGESCVDAALRLGFRAATTWPGGAAAVRKADFSPLAGADAVIIPDRDEPGERAARDVARALASLGATLRLWRVPSVEGVNDVGDLWARGLDVDALEDHDVRELIDDSPTSENDDTAALFVDVAAILDGTAAPITPTTGGRRDDGLRLLYARATNVLVGDPETGKTLVAAAMAVQVLRDGGSVLWLDLDHNGRAIVDRLVMLGAEHAHLRDRARFRFAEPDEPAVFDAIVADAAARPVTLAVVDSVGELLPLFGASSDSADDYTAVNRRTLARLARTGAAVVAVDHLAKSATSREYGGTGTVAKKRAVDGVMYRVTTPGGFAPGRGGTAVLAVVKDRHGGIRARVSTGGREPTAARFEMWQTPGADRPSWRFTTPPTAADTPDDLAADVAAMRRLQPASMRKARQLSGMRATRSDAAFRAWRAELDMGE